MLNKLNNKERRHLAAVKELDCVVCNALGPSDETWVPVYGYEGIYEASNLGRIKSLQRYVKTGTGIRFVPEKIIKPILGTRGYFVVNFTAKGKRTQHFLHKLILQSFVGERPLGKEACHNNGNKLDCSIQNLRWDTRSGNHKDKRIHGTWQIGEKANNSKLTEAVVREIRMLKMKPSDAVKKYGLSSTNAKRICNYETWKHVNV